MRQLIERRVPHFLLAYVGVGWGIVQIFDFLERYGISPHWTDLSLLALALLLPSVLLFTYNHGRPGKDEITRSDKIGIPLNIILAGVVLFMVFNGKNLGATTRSIHLLDESGKEVERTVANASYHKRVALFDFDVPPGDTAAAWLRYGLPIALSVDLAQNMFIDVRPSAFFRERLRQMQIASDAAVPVALKRQLAEERHLPYFTDAMVTRNGQEVTVNFAVYESAQGNQVAQHQFKNTDILALADEISAALRKDLDLPEPKEAKDLRVTDLLTGSLPAYRAFVDGVTGIQVSNRWQEALPKLENAVALDPQFAQAQFTLHTVYLLSNQMDKAMPPLQKAMDFEYRMPERERYDMRVEYFMMKKEADKAFAAANMKVQLYPEDVTAYVLRAQMQQVRNDKAGMIESLKKVLELDPAQQDMVRQIGSLYESQAQYDSALHYYSRYAELYPSREEPFVAMAGVNRLRGEAEQARGNYNKALANAPEDMSALLGLAAVSTDVGDFDGAKKQYEDALSKARTPAEKFQALDGLASYYEFRGQFSRAIGFREQALTERRKIEAPFNVDVQQLSTLGAYVRAGRAADAKKLLQSISARLEGPFAHFRALGETEIALEQRDADVADKAITVVDEAIKALGFDIMRALVVRGRARVAELRGNCEEALRYRQEQVKLEPTSAGLHTDMARCYRTMGQTQKAIEEAQTTLKVRPFDPRANYEIALDYLAANDQAKALEHLRRAVEIWKNADPSYSLAAEARAKLRTVEADSH